jgi:hypothetical protein
VVDVVVVNGVSCGDRVVMYHPVTDPLWLLLLLLWSSHCGWWKKK